jgi:hypothetical protein
MGGGNSMSKISLTPNALGTGTFTIASPGTSTNRTLTLPDETGTFLVGTQPAGDIVGTTATQTLTNKSIVATQLTGDVAAARITTALNASGSAPIYACRAWVNFNGTGTVAIRASGNVSSITDNGTGDYTVNFTTAMPDANYCWSTSSGRTANDVNFANQSRSDPTTSALRFVTLNVSFVATDMTFCAVAIFR